MRAILTNFGTTGSVHPFFALAVELKRNEHQPVLALSPFFASWAERLGIDFVPIGPDLREVQYDINTAMLEMPDTSEVMRDLFAPLMPSLPQIFSELRDVCREADVLISGPWQVASPMIHELTGITFVTVQNSHFGGGGTPAFQHATASLVNPFREQMGLGPVRNPLTIDANSTQLVLYNMSRHVRPRPPDWPSYYHMPGYFALDEEWKPDHALVDFLEANEPPVVFTFGSMTHGDPEALTELILESIERVGCCAVIQHGWTGLGKIKVPPHIHATGFVSHDWLFPRASCIVHHGGAGTAGAVFRSGKPSVFVPHSFDHPLWAELARDIGCAGLPIPFAEISADRLTEAIKTTLEIPAYSRAAADLGEKVRAEQGVVKARRLIEQLVQRVGWSAQEQGTASQEFAVASKPEDKMSRRKQYLQQQHNRRRERIAFDEK